FSSRRRHTRFSRDWSSDVCSSDLGARPLQDPGARDLRHPAPADPLEDEISAEANALFLLALRAFGHARGLQPIRAQRRWQSPRFGLTRPDPLPTIEASSPAWYVIGNGCVEPILHHRGHFLPTASRPSERREQAPVSAAPTC